LAHALRGERSAFAIVGSDEADELVRLQTGIDDHRGNACAFRIGDWPHERVIVERREHDAAHTLRRETFDDLDLLFAIVFTQRAFPDHFYVGSLRFEFLRGLVAAGVNAFPELVRRALGDDRDS
jgi:hypothetical protein